MTATPGNGQEPVDDPMTRRTWAAFLYGVVLTLGVGFTALTVGGVL